MSTPGPAGKQGAPNSMAQSNCLRVVFIMPSHHCSQAAGMSTPGPAGNQGTPGGRMGSKGGARETSTPGKPSRMRQPSSLMDAEAGADIQGEQQEGQRQQQQDQKQGQEQQQQTQQNRGTGVHKEAGGKAEGKPQGGHSVAKKQAAANYLQSVSSVVPPSSVNTTQAVSCLDLSVTCQAGLACLPPFDLHQIITTL